MDIRNPSIIKILGWDAQHIGLSEVLNGKVRLEDAILIKDDNKFKVLPGMSGQDSVDVLYSDQLAKVFKELREKAEYILIDTAPSALLSDASLLAGYADACIFVVCQDYAPIDRIKEGIDMLTDSGLRIAGCILNQSENGIVGYGSGYGYGLYGNEKIYSRYYNYKGE